MSASSKKKLRHAEQAEKLTEKQLAAQQEAKKLKLYTTLAVVILIALVVFAAYVGISRTIANSGVRERNTVAVTIGETSISNAEFNYFFVDAVNNFYNQYGAYASLLGLDTATPLDEQYVNEETQQTWADDFINTAIENAKATYAIANEAKANGYVLSESAVTEVDNVMATVQLYATMYGFTDTDSYLKAMYGSGANEKSLREYQELCALATNYQNEYAASLTYTKDQLRAAEAEDYDKYSSYDYNYYYLNVLNFIEGDSTEYTAEQRAAAAKKAEEAAKELTKDITTVEKFDAAIAALPMNADLTDVASYSSTNTFADSIYTGYADWVTESSRKTGDMTYVEATSTTTDDNGNTVEQINGYYVVMFVARNDNEYPLANVRHILVSYEGGSYDSTTGVTTYSDDEKAAAMEAAINIHNEWKNSAATEESFAELANSKSSDGDGTTGGLYEDVYPGQMVSAFDYWCFDDRKPGDTDVIETEYGYHVMYYSGDSETTYRDHLISTELKENDFTAWFNALTEALTVTEGSFKYVLTDLTLGG